MWRRGVRLTRGLPLVGRQRGAPRRRHQELQQRRSSVQYINNHLPTRDSLVNLSSRISQSLHHAVRNFRLVSHHPEIGAAPS